MLSVNECRQLARLGQAACEQSWGVEPFDETGRNIRDLHRRAGRLPEQRDGDAVDYRPLLHRDGSVLSPVSLQVPLGPAMACPLSSLCQASGWLA